MRSRRRFRLLPLLPALAGLLTAAVVLWFLLPGLLQRLAATELLDHATVLTPLVEARLGDELQRFVQELPNGTDLRITLVDRTGNVVAESARKEGELPLIENHASRPEIRAAFEKGSGWASRRSATTGVEYVYAARAFVGPTGERLALRLARPLDHVQSSRLRLAAAFLPALAAALLVAALVFLEVERRFGRPLSQIVDGATRLADGRYEARLTAPEEEPLRSLAQALNRLGGRVVEQIGAAEAERDHLRSILACMSEGVLVVDGHGRAVLVNQAFRKLFGVRGEVTGFAPLELSRQPRLAQCVEATLAGRVSESDEIELEIPERRVLSLASASLGDGGGAIVVARDMTAFHRLTKVRRDFVANVSHELKTPLAAIRGYAETLRDGALDDAPTARRFTDRILVQCKRLQALLEDLLTLSRLESADAAALPFEAVDLAVANQHALELIGEIAREKRLRVAVASDGPCIVRGHAQTLERLIVNLLENAAKYNRPGGSVAVRLGHRKDRCVLEVEDTGFGIPAEALPRIFERFYRVDKGRAREEGGTGLGLAIVKHIAQLHGGTVEVQSEEGRGSTFRVTLPSASASAHGTP